MERYPGEAVHLLRNIAGYAPQFREAVAAIEARGVEAMKKNIEVPALARVEGEGGLYIRLKNGEIAQVELNIYEPPRFFEGFLQGRYFQEVPDITARICGICPVAYQMSSVQALEAALGVIDHA